MRAGLILALAGLLAPLQVHQVQAAPGLDFGLAETVDIVSILSGPDDRRLRVLDNTDVTLDADLETLAGWQSTRAHIYVLGNHGARPNEIVGSLEGFDNIEVARSGVRLFEAWIEKDLGKGSLLAGLFDLNSEFYVTESAATLLSPPFGIGSEFAGSGVNGPSIFPSSSLALRAQFAPGVQGLYVSGALVDADAASWGDPHGVDFSFHEGLLGVAEAGWDTDGVKFALGGWAYTKAHDHLWATRPDGRRLAQNTWGLYALLDARLTSPSAERSLSAFIRGGWIEGQATPFKASAQAGLLFAPTLARRPASALSIGIHGAWTNQAQRALVSAQGRLPSAFERGMEITFSDEILPGLTIQPDFQIIQHAGGQADSRLVTLALLRIAFAIE